MNDYDVVWDEEEAKGLDSLARVLLKDEYHKWADLIQKLKDAPFSLRDSKEDEYYIFDEYIEDNEGDLTHGILSEIFMLVIHTEYITEHVDWKGENEEGQLIEFATNRYGTLSGNYQDKDEMKKYLLEITKNDAVKDVYKDGDRYVDIVFSRIQNELNMRKFTLKNINNGTDTHNVFVIATEDFELINNFSNEYLSVLDF